MTKPYIKYTTYDTDDWVVLDVNCEEDFYFEGHSVPDFKWIELIEMLGFKVEREEVKYEEEEWFFPDEKMPDIGDNIVVRSWDGEDMDIMFSSFPTNVKESNVMMWRYA